MILLTYKHILSIYKYICISVKEWRIEFFPVYNEFKERPLWMSQVAWYSLQVPSGIKQPYFQNQKFWFKIDQFLINSIIAF